MVCLIRFLGRIRIMDITGMPKQCSRCYIGPRRIQFVRPTAMDSLIQTKKCLSRNDYVPFEYGFCLIVQINYIRR